jgi:hypothetical protein
MAIFSLRTEMQKLREKLDMIESNVNNLRDTHFKTNIMTQKDDLLAEHSVFKNMAHISHQNKNLTGRRDREKLLKTYELEGDEETIRLLKTRNSMPPST